LRFQCSRLRPGCLEPTCFKLGVLLQTLIECVRRLAVQVESRGRSVESRCLPASQLHGGKHSDFTPKTFVPKRESLSANYFLPNFTKLLEVNIPALLLDTTKSRCPTTLAYRFPSPGSDSYIYWTLLYILRIPSKKAQGQSFRYDGPIL
jgi:hypothetical protein